ncbi:hypothetical protein J3U11_06915 [Gilliamella sp. B2840]|nr:hypothetical protein [Gilliamella sp. B2840]MCX8700797.1 hypothetical protein [Gilliamella sp. B2840]
MHLCHKGRSITINPEPFDRDMVILPLTLNAIGRKGSGGDKEEQFYWRYGWLRIIIKNNANSEFIERNLMTSTENLTVSTTLSVTVPSNVTFFVTTELPSKSRVDGIPDFITIMTVKK